MNDNVNRIYYTPVGDDDEDQQEAVSIEVHGGPKRYMTIWPGYPNQGIDWSWVIPATATLIYEADQ